MHSNKVCVGRKQTTQCIVSKRGQKAKKKKKKKDSNDIWERKNNNT